jgi:hypothetical protein
MITLNHYESPSRTLIIVMAAAPLAVLAGCGGSGSSTPSASSPIAVGYELPLTGTVAVPGKTGAGGLEPRAQGVRDSVAGHRIATYFEHTGGNPAVALSDARSLVQQRHIQLMEGPDVEPWGTLPYRTGQQEFTPDSTGRLTAAAPRAGCQGQRHCRRAGQSVCNCAAMMANGRIMLTGVSMIAMRER